jgi:cytochrome c5
MRAAFVAMLGSCGLSLQRHSPRSLGSTGPIRAAVIGCVAILCSASATLAGSVLAASDNLGAKESVEWSAQTKIKPEGAAVVVEVVDVGDASKGLNFAQNICSACHNVLWTETPSPNERAPPFKRIANIPGMSITALTVWSRTSHPTMPNLVIGPEDMDDLIAYILSLRGR